MLDRFGQGRASTVIAGIAWAIAHKDELGIRVLNISIGGNPSGPAAEDPLAQAVEAAWEAGIVVVCAAGNEGEFGLGGVLSPGNDPAVITVGATDTRQTADLADDVVCAYSSMGPDALRRGREARPRRPGEPPHLAAREGELHRPRPSPRT